MYSFLMRIFFVLVKLCMIQAYSHNYDSGRSGYGDVNNQMTKQQFNNPEHDVQDQGSNPRYNDEDEVLSIGNGYNRNNVVILDDGTSHHNIHNKNQISSYDSEMVSISNTGNGRNTVVINGKVYSNSGTTYVRRNHNGFKKNCSKGNHNFNSLFSPIIISCVLLICKML